MTLNQLIELFKAIGDAHYFIKTTQFGEVPDKAESPIEEVVYPAFYQVPTNTVTRDNVVERTFNLIVCDVVHPDNDNINEVLSDTEQTLNDIIKILRQESYDYTLINDPVLTPFKDGFGDDVTGWYVEVVVQTDNNSGYCDIPAIDFGYPGQSGSGGVPGSGGLDCSDLADCPIIIDIQETLAGLTGATASPSDLSSVLGVGNSTGNQTITAGTNLGNILQVSDTVMGMSWNGVIGGNVTLDDSGTYVYSDSSVYIESQTEVNIDGPITNLNSDVNLGGTLIYSGSYSTLSSNTALVGVNNQIFIGSADAVDIDNASTRSGYFGAQSNPFGTTNVVMGARQYSLQNYITSYVNSTASQATIIGGNQGIFRGAEYDVDYSPEFSPLSLVNKQWVEDYLGTASPTPNLQTVLSVGNSTGNQPITSSNSNVILNINDNTATLYWSDGVSPAESSFVANTSGTQMYFGDSTGNVIGNINNNLAGISINHTNQVDATAQNILFDGLNKVLLNAPSVRLTTTDGFSLGMLNINGAGIPINDGSIDNTFVIVDAIYSKGIALADDYSANFTDESLITKRWVTNFVGTASPPTPTPSLQDVITVNGTINGLLSQSPDTSTYIYMGDGYIDMSSYNGSATSGFNMYAAGGNTLYSDISNILSSPKITLTASGTASMIMNQYNTTFTGNVTVTSNNDNAGISIVSPAGFYYPSLGFYNVGNNFLGAITGYAGQLYIGGVSGTPLIVNSAAINLPLETVNSLLYVDSGNNVKSARLGNGLTFSGLTLSTTATIPVISTTTVISTATSSIIDVSTPNTYYSVTSLSSSITFTTSGTYSNFDKMVVRIKDNGATQSLTFDPTYYEAKGQALPTTTVISKVLTIGFIYDSVTTKFGCVSVAQEI